MLKISVTVAHIRVVRLRWWCDHLPNARSHKAKDAAIKTKFPLLVLLIGLSCIAIAAFSFLSERARPSSFVLKAIDGCPGLPPNETPTPWIAKDKCGASPLARQIMACGVKQYRLEMNSENTTAIIPLTPDIEKISACLMFQKQIRIWIANDEQQG
ncbi:hypothetical protein [Sphingobium sp.]|uniref:hypothetical protein n=1 Tax=Sphingobium sp. TaxID=1912891 RepID=UPI0025DD8238|nr:hypothetical protein [Sphingobium sp.]